MGTTRSGTPFRPFITTIPFLGNWEKKKKTVSSKEKLSDMAYQLRYLVITKKSDNNYT